MYNPTKEQIAEEIKVLLFAMWQLYEEQHPRDIWSNASKIAKLEAKIKILADDNLEQIIKDMNDASVTEVYDFIKSRLGL
jgi:fatty acid/phospholipid biosynthesis enzyme